MHTWLAIVFVFVATTTVSADDIGNSAPPKPTSVVPPNVPAPGRQGGDTIADATLIPSLPFSDAGTTAGHANDYDLACPYTDSTAPDVVYEYRPATSEVVSIDLCGSGYDTKLYVYDQDLNPLACNDDTYFGEPCGMYVSKLENITLRGGESCYIVVDGYGLEYGEYALAVDIFVPCDLFCPPAGAAEGEPELVANYIDSYNGGCFTPPANPLQDLTGDTLGDRVLCGVSGWYVTDPHTNCRDTDWFLLHMGPTGAIEVTVDAEQRTGIHEMFPDHCDHPGVLQSTIAERCQAASMTISSFYDPGDEVWLMLCPTVFVAPAGFDNEYNYIIWLSGLEPAVATESTTWGAVKALYE